MMRDKIVFTVTGKLQELLLRVDSLTLENAVKVCRAYEQSNPPAWGKTCDNCKGRNHFKSKCKKVHAVSQSQDDNYDYDDQ